MFDVSIYLGRFFGLYLMITGVALIVRSKSFRTMTHDFLKSPALIILSGTMTLILGLLLVLAHNIWVWNWQVIVTVLAYVTLIKGITLLYIPEWMKAFAHHFDKLQRLRLHGAIILILGIYLVICTFFGGN